ncbi:BTAD domain-containing putative transcriptional regulator [Streptomyces sp. NPDC050535]|uniref:AfsR/SARP family transcriptional regulator n=1 Tax=Streptomyces sp. NPDC050535 TaxID=3365626 RepID=UPI0037921D27
MGPLSVVGGDERRPVPLGPLKQRIVLAVLLCHPNDLVSVESLVDALWDGGPPKTARKNIQVYVSALRRLLEDVEAGGRLVCRAGGYLLQVGDEELDSLRFRDLSHAARVASRQGALDSAAGLLREALNLWSGPSLPELRCSRAVSDEADRLGKRYLQVYEDWAETELRLGNPEVIADTIGELLELHPQRERLRAAHMDALFQLGRQTEAFGVYDEYRQFLAGEFGLDPSPALEARYRSMLTGGRSL